MTRLSFSLLVASLAFARVMSAGDDPRMEQYERIVGEYDAARAEGVRAMKAAKTDEEERAIKWPRPNDFSPRLLALTEGRTDDAAGRKATLWVLEHNYEIGDAGKRVPRVSRAIDGLLKYHKDDESVGLALLDIVDYPSPIRDRLFRAISEQTSNRANRGRATLALAQYLKAKGEYAQWLRTPALKSDDPTRLMEIKVHGADYFGSLAVDPLPLLAESERLFERVVAEYAEIDHLPHHRFPGRTRSLGEIAANDLDELRRLSVGKPAPEIEGRDVDGRVMTLSEHRGKVVVLVFWGGWCGSCMAQVPHERILAERMKGRPFAIVGVNSDEDRDKLQATIAREKITWRSWFDDGRVGGPIARDWNVKFWPTVYVLDHRGVIRAREVYGDAFLDGIVDGLVADAERASGR